MGNCMIQKQSSNSARRIAAPKLKIQHIVEIKSKSSRYVVGNQVALLAEHSQKNQFICIVRYGRLEIRNSQKGSLKWSILLKEEMSIDQCEFQNYRKSYGCLTSTKALRILAVKTFKQIRKLTSNITRILRVSFEGVQFNSHNKELYIFNPTNGITTVATLEYSDIDYSLDGQYLAYTSLDLQSIIVVNLQCNTQQQIKWSLRGGFSQGSVKILQFSHDSKYLIYSIKYLGTNVIKVYQSSPLQLLWEIRGSFSYSISKDSKYLAISEWINCYDGFIKFYSIVNGQVLIEQSNKAMLPLLLLENRLIGADKRKLIMYG